MKSILYIIIAAVVYMTVYAEQFDKTKPAVCNWYGDDTYFGYEYDMHANNNDKDLGAAISVDYLVKMFKIVKPDLLQTDTKGHEGLVSWYSQTPALRS